MGDYFIIAQKIGDGQIGKKMWTKMRSESRNAHEDDIQIRLYVYTRHL